MRDIQINSSGDLEAIKLTERGGEVLTAKTDEAVYDLSTVENNTNLRLKRALKTPLGHIALYVIDSETVNIIDGFYGNNIYKELSEGLTLNFISRARSHVISALKRASLNAEVSNVQINILDSHTIQIFITYSTSINPTSVEIKI